MHPGGMDPAALTRENTTFRDNKGAPVIWVVHCMIWPNAGGIDLIKSYLSFLHSLYKNFGAPIPGIGDEKLREK